MEFLAKYQQIISQEIESNSFKQKPSELYEPLNYILSHGGKRIRPVLLLLAADIFGENLAKAVRPALAIEFFHNFTLIHDDIMDEAPLRRGIATIHSIHGISTGILSGDALLIKSYRYFEELEPELFKKCISLFSETGEMLCEGQQLDINFESTDSVSFEEYEEMVTKKTGVLLAAALKMGALIGGAAAQDADSLYNFGINAGIAFQMMDDYLDVFGSQEQVGKRRAGDIYENKKTILYILALQNADAQQQDELKYWYSKKTENTDKIYGVEKIFRSTSADTKTLELIREYHQRALESLNESTLTEEKKKPFRDFAHSLLQREF
ncbi:polyprenyl synthetase family protein [Cruoricaptor ignavus]|uniref:Polyprenyl synthetase family protein n=1 Tax=Cruoricaptor ignavus TaxID=1118202 RepID=A0A7M1T1U9_9FLAO|nr:polyprenyl synthetase family protein [Cruoricaptor ignavus]QOR73799.1 polyprenyl synthetase family protein [Cruoricaptor ignavus]